MNNSKLIETINKNHNENHTEYLSKTTDIKEAEKKDNIDCVEVLYYALDYADICTKNLFKGLDIIGDVWCKLQLQIEFEVEELDFENQEELATSEAVLEEYNNTYIGDILDMPQKIANLYIENWFNKVNVDYARISIFEIKLFLDNLENLIKRVEIKAFKMMEIAENNIVENKGLLIYSMSVVNQIFDNSHSLVEQMRNLLLIGKNIKKEDFKSE